MTDIASFVPLPARGLIEVSGADARGFLQGLISNDVEKATPERAIYAALLSPQGKFLHDFIIAAHGEGLLLDCERARLPDLGQRLAGYKLRARVTLADASDDMRVAAAFGEEALARLGLAREAGACRPLAAGFSCVDPRDQKLGARVYLPAEAGMTPLTELGFVAAPSEQYEALRLKLGVPDGSRDMTIDKATLLENNFEALHGVDFSKGCYVGQELTARTKYRGLVKRRLTRVRIDGPPPPPGAPLTIAGKEAGEMRTALPGFGLALLRLDRLEETNDTPLESGVARLWPLREGDSQG